MELYRKIVARLLSLINFISFFTVVGVNIYGSAGTVSVANISDKYPTSLTPAGSAFSIWGLIYTLQALWIVSQVATFIFGWYNELQHSRIGFGYMIISILNIIWILLFVNEQLIAAFIIIFLFWLGLGIIYFRININYGFYGRFNLKYQNFSTGFQLSKLLWAKIQSRFSSSIQETEQVNTNTLNKPVYTHHSDNMLIRVLIVLFDTESYENPTNETPKRPIKLWEYWIVQSAFSIYFAWLSGAMILCLGSMLSRQGYSDVVNGSTWAVVWLILLSCLSIGLIGWRRDFIFGATFTWTSAWIAVKQMDNVVKMVAVTVSSITGFFTLMSVLIMFVEFILYPPYYLTYILFGNKKPMV